MTSKRIPRMMPLWGNASIHRSMEVKDCLYMNRHKLETYSFLAYALELNYNECIFTQSAKNLRTSAWRTRKRWSWAS